MLQQLLLSSPSSSLPSHGVTQLQKPTFLSSCNSIITTSTIKTLGFFTRTNLALAPKRVLLSVKCRESSSDYFEQSTPRFSPTYTPNPPFLSTGSPTKVFVGHSIYKGKAALTVEPRAPEFVPLESGAYKISREGYILLQFAPAAGVRQYDWSRKQVFSLSVAEIGSLISLGAKESCEFFHDPNKGRRTSLMEAEKFRFSDEGKVRKVLKVEPLPDGSGHFFNLSVQNKLLNLDESIYIPISKAEFAVLVSAFNFILPFLLGWQAFVDTVRPEDSGRVNNANPRSGRVDYEWSR